MFALSSPAEGGGLWDRQMVAAWKRGKNQLNPNEASWKEDGIVRTASEKLSGEHSRRGVGSGAVRIVCSVLLDSLKTYCRASGRFGSWEGHLVLKALGFGCHSGSLQLSWMSVPKWQEKKLVGRKKDWGWSSKYQGLCCSLWFSTRRTIIWFPETHTETS